MWVDHQQQPRSGCTSRLRLKIAVVDGALNRLLPISRSLLHSILDKLVFLSSSPYEYLYRCLFLLAYYCCLRAGEAVVSTHPQHTLQLLSFSQFSDSSHSTLTIRFSSYKHFREQITFVLEGTSTTNCPVQAFSDYTKLRSSVAGSIFLHSSGVPLSRKDFCSRLHLCLSLLNLDAKAYNTHSFRIGRTTDLYEAGFSLADIQTIGRWNSSAYQTYIRRPSFSLPL